MTNRKFTPPTEFSAEYVTSDGCKAVLMAQTPDDTYPYIGWYDANGVAVSSSWGKNGEFYPNGVAVSSRWVGNDDSYEGGVNQLDLHDPLNKQVRWMNDYGEEMSGGWHSTRKSADQVAYNPDRIAVIRREWTEGQPPQYFMEEV